MVACFLGCEKSCQGQTHVTEGLPDPEQAHVSTLCLASVSCSCLMGCVHTVGTGWTKQGFAGKETVVSGAPFSSLAIGNHSQCPVRNPSLSVVEGRSAEAALEIGEIAVVINQCWLQLTQLCFMPTRSGPAMEALGLMGL